MIIYTINTPNSRQEIEDHLRKCSADFVPPLGERVDITEYAKKIRENATQFEAWSGERLVGLLAVYEREWFITNVSVLPAWQQHGIAGELMKRCINHAINCGARRLELKVHWQNLAAVSFYRKHGFVFGTAEVGGNVTMVKHLTEAQGTLHVSGNTTTAASPFDTMTRDTPTAKYAYSFDLDVMHPMMIRTFEPWFRPHGSKCLELGSYQSAFTKRLLNHFNEVVCIEASKDARAKAIHSLGGKSCRVKLVGERFETVGLLQNYDNIFMTHVLEHVEDPVRVLRRVNDEWLAPGGRFFLACPNANAASRQIAFQMGALKSLHGVTNNEFQHGHHRTYSLDTLECHAREAGLNVIARGGIFFKALANKQLDAAKGAGIIDDAYLEGCYQLGQVYPDLCASIYLICEKGGVK